MSILKNKLVYSLGIYTIANVVNQAIPFLLLPLLTYYLQPADYGVLSNFNSLINLLIPFISLNLMTSLQVIYVKDKEVFPSYISSGLSVMGGLTVFFSAALFFFAHELSKFLGVPVHFIYFTSVYAMYQNLVEVLLSIWRMENKAIHFGVFRILRTVVEVGLAIILIVVYKQSFEGSIYAMIYSYGLGSLITLVILFKKGLIVTELKKQHMLHLVRYGLPLVPHVFASVFLMYTDKLALTKYHGLTANGIYSVGFMVGQVIGLLQNSFNQAWVPWAFEKLKENTTEGKRKMVYWTYVYMLGILAITLLFYLCSPLIFMFLGKDYSGGLTLVIWIALGFAFNGMYKMVSVYFFYAERTKEIGLISIITAIINFGMVLLWVPKYAYVGAACSTMTAFFIQFVLTWYWGNKIIPMPWGLKKSKS